MKIVWTDPAVSDLEAIHDYIARDSEHYARQLVARLVEAVEPLQDFPEMGRRVPEADEELRELIVQGYRVIYQVTRERLEVLTVVHGRRDLAAKPWSRG